MSGPSAGSPPVNPPTPAPCTDMPGHLFLTGENGAGKSTLLQWLLERKPRRLGGFRTVKTNAVFAGHYTVHMLKIAENEQPSTENLLFFCDLGMDETTVEHFDWLGCLALEESRDAELLVMDELGPHEGEALRFQEAVLHALDGEIPILGVLQKADTPFLRRVASHPKVQLLEINEVTWDDLTF